MLEQRERDVQKRFAITVANDEQLRRIREEEERVAREETERNNTQARAKRAMDEEKERRLLEARTFELEDWGERVRRRHWAVEAIRREEARRTEERLRASPAWINKDQFAADDAIRKVQEREEQRRKDFDCQQRLFMKGFYHYIHYQKPLKNMAKRMNDQGAMAGKEALVDQIYYASDPSQLPGLSAPIREPTLQIERSLPTEDDVAPKHQRLPPPKEPVQPQGRPLEPAYPMEPTYPPKASEILEYGQESAYAKPTLELLRDYHLEYRPVAQATKPVGWATEPADNYAAALTAAPPQQMQEPALSMRDDLPVYDPLDLRRIGGVQYDYLKRPVSSGRHSALKGSNYGGPGMNVPLSSY
jgi:hypothetical protein